MWHNKTTGEMTAGNPWGHNGYFNPEKIPEFYPDWERLPEGFIPPAAQKVPVTAPEVDEGRADLWEAYLALLTEVESLKGGA